MNDDYPMSICPRCNGHGKIPKCICTISDKNGVYSLMRNPKCRVNHNKYFAGKYQE